MKELVNELYELIDKKQGDDISVLDFRNNSPFVDYFIICTARNNRLAHAILDEVEDYADKNNIQLVSKDASKDANWLLIDLGSIVVHVFVNEERYRYNLDGLWKDLEIKL